MVLIEQAALIEHPPVLLVHGVDDNNKRFGRMRKALSAQVWRGASPLLLHAMDILPNNASISIEAMGKQVLDEATQLQMSANDARIDIVAFSMGALATRYFIQRLGGKDRVRRFVSLSGPHHGTLSAYLRQNTGSRQMRPGSLLLQDLNADADPWGAVEVFAFWSRLDLMIFPANSSSLPHAQQRLFNVPLHFLMITDHQVIRAVVQALS